MTWTTRKPRGALSLARKAEEAIVRCIDWTNTDAIMFLLLLVLIDLTEDRRESQENVSYHYKRKAATTMDRIGNDSNFGRRKSLDYKQRKHK